MIELSWFKSLTNTEAQRRSLDWDAAVQLLTTPLEVAAKEAAPLYSPALYNGTPRRSNVNVVGMSALVLDFDNDHAGVPTAPDDALSNLPDDISYIWHSTFSATEDKPKWRLVIPFSRIVDPREWMWIVKGSLQMMGNDDGLDKSSGDLSRAFFVMSCPPGGVRASGFRAGILLDPQYLLDQADAPPLDLSTPLHGAVASSPRPAKQSGKVTGRNNILRGVVTAMLGRSESWDKIISEILKVDATHNPPLFSDPSEPQYSGLPPEVGAMSFVTSIVKSIALARAKQGLPPELPRNTEIQVEEPEEEIEEDTFPGTMPEYLLNPGGFLQEMTDWINAGAHRKQPILALGAAIATMGTIMGRKVKTETNLRTNLYIVGIGETSCGKEHARQCIKSLFHASECEDYLGPENLASDSGLLVAVHNQPAMLLMIDEIGWLLKAVTSQYAKPYMKNIAQVLMQLHSSAGSVMKGKTYADKERKQENIQQPNVCLYGTSVPGRFHAALTRDEVEDGFVPRMVVFESEDPSPPRRRIKNIPPPENLIQLVRYWHDLPVGNQSAFGKLAGYAAVPDPREVVCTTDADAIFSEFEEFVREQANECRPRGVAGLWGKTEAMALQLALIHALSLNPEGRFIEAVSAEWAIGSMTYLTKKMVRMAEKNLNANQYEADVKKVLQIIYEQGKEGMKRSALLRRCQWMPKRVFDEVMVLLEETAQVRKIKKRDGVRGPEVTGYVIRQL